MEAAIPDLGYFAAREGCLESELRITTLGGGVSNHVLLVESPSRRYVVKQALAKLRVKEDWFSDRSRIWREAEALRFLAPVVSGECVPEVLYEDRENYLVAMSIARGEQTWKSLLMTGEATEAQAENIGRIHAELLRAGLRFDDAVVFDQLRLDPYYRFTAGRHPDLASYFEGAIERCGRRRSGLVHGDWSPKNLIVDGDHVTAIDFEVVHYGDPAFDAAFLLNHLLLKGFFQPQFGPLYQRLRRAYWKVLDPDANIREGTLQHLPLLLLARVDGKSPVEYIQDEAVKQRIRDFARAMLTAPPGEALAFVFDRAAD